MCREPSLCSGVCWRSLPHYERGEHGLFVWPHEPGSHEDKVENMFDQWRCPCRPRGAYYLA